MLDRAKKEKERQEVLETALRSYQTAVEDAFALQERTLEFARSLFEVPAETLRTQAASNRATLDTLAAQSKRQQEALENLLQEYTSAYLNLLQAPFSYYRNVMEAMTAPWVSGAPESRVNAEPPLQGYDSMNVREVSEKLDDLSVEELQRLRDYEVRNKNRHALVERLNQRIENDA